MRVFILCLSLSAVAGCALPIASEHASLSPDGAQTRLFTGEDVFADAAPLDFSFVLHTDAPQVVLADVSGTGPTGFSSGEPTWAQQPWVGAELMVRTDADVHAVPVELLVRQGEPFVAQDGLGGTCLGYLGELSVIHVITRYAIYDFADLTDEEYAFVDDDTSTSPPTERLADPAFTWGVAQRRYLVARWESDDDCVAQEWGHHPEHAPGHFAEIPSEPFAEEAHRVFRAHPEYAPMQESYDAILAEATDYEGIGNAWAAGPWDDRYFGARAFEARDGRQMVIASADLSDGCEIGPSALHVVYDVASDGALVRRQTFPGLPRYGYTALILRDSALHFLTTDSLITLDEHYETQSVGPLEYGCGC